MNFNELIKWTTAIILGWSAIHHIDDIQKEIWRAQASLLYGSRTATWGSPKLLRAGEMKTNESAIHRPAH